MYLKKQYNTYSAYLQIPKDVRHHFGKRAFTKSLGTGNEDIAKAKAMPLVVQWKADIAEARGKPAPDLLEYLASMRETLADKTMSEGAREGLEFELIDTLESKAEPADQVRLFKETTGQLTVFDAYLDDYIKDRAVEAKTKAKDEHAIKKFSNHCDYIQNVDKRSVREFVKGLYQDGQGVSVRTIRDNLSTLAVYYRWLLDEEIIDGQINPFKDVRLPAENRKVKAEEVRLAFNVQDVQRLNKAIMSGRNDDLKHLFKMAIYTGCRIEELCSLSPEFVTSNTIQIVKAKTKAGNRIIPIHSKLRPLMKELKALSAGQQFILPNLIPNKYGVRSAQPSKNFGRVKTKMGFDKRYVFHSLRGTVATQLEQAGVEEAIASSLLGHQKKTMGYGLYSDGSSMNQMREAVEKIDYELD